MIEVEFDYAEALCERFIDSEGYDTVYVTLVVNIVVHYSYNLCSEKFFPVGEFFYHIDEPVDIDDDHGVMHDGQGRIASPLRDFERELLYIARSVAWDTVYLYEPVEYDEDEFDKDPGKFYKNHEHITLPDISDEILDELHQGFEFIYCDQ